MIVSVDTVSIPHVDAVDRITVRALEQRTVQGLPRQRKNGCRNKLNVPDALALAREQGLLDRNLDLEHASYFVSRDHEVAPPTPITPAIATLGESSSSSPWPATASPIAAGDSPRKRLVLIVTEVALTQTTSAITIGRSFSA